MTLRGILLVVAEGSGQVPAFRLLLLSVVKILLRPAEQVLQLEFSRARNSEVAELYERVCFQRFSVILYLLRLDLA